MLSPPALRGVVYISYILKNKLFGFESFSPPVPLLRLDIMEADLANKLQKKK